MLYKYSNYNTVCLPVILLLVITFAGIILLRIVNYFKIIAFAEQYFDANI